MHDVVPFGFKYEITIFAFIVAAVLDNYQQ